MEDDEGAGGEERDEEQGEKAGPSNCLGWKGEEADESRRGHGCAVPLHGRKFAGEELSLR